MSFIDGGDVSGLMEYARLDPVKRVDRRTAFLGSRWTPARRKLRKANGMDPYLTCDACGQGQNRKAAGKKPHEEWIPKDLKQEAGVAIQSAAAVARLHSNAPMSGHLPLREPAHSITLASS